MIESIAMEINFSLATGIPTESPALKIAPEINTEGYFIILLDVESATKINNSLRKISGGQAMTQ